MFPTWTLGDSGGETATRGVYSQEVILADFLDENVTRNASLRKGILADFDVVSGTDQPS